MSMPYAHIHLYLKPNKANKLINKIRISNIQM